MEVNKNPIVRLLLSPFSGLYGLITSLRNAGFDKGISSSYRSETPTIVVGNLSVGGTGKTPMIEFLIEHLSPLRIGLISRGYGRQSKGLLAVDPTGKATDYGDESLQITQKYPIQAWVSEERKLGIQAAEAANCELLLLDDAFQHRQVSGHKNIMLSRFDQAFFSDHLLPGGGLRESRSGAQRADFIVFTKCPKDLSETQKKEYRARSAYYSKAQVLFSHLAYGQIQDQNGNDLGGNARIILVTGIANPEPLQAHLEETYGKVELHRFKDHHQFTKLEMETLLQRASESQSALVCTDKDRVKLLPLVEEQPIFSVPVRHQFSKEDEKLLIDDLQGLIRP